MALLNPSSLIHPLSTSPAPRPPPSSAGFYPSPTSLFLRPPPGAAAAASRLSFAPLLSLRNRRLPVFSYAQDSSEPSDIEIGEQGNGHLEDKEDGTEQSQREEAWKEALESFKEQALKFQAVSQEAYQLYSEKAIVILSQTSEKLKIQADKATQDLTIVAKDIALESKEILANAAENSPEPVKDIVETFSSASVDEFDDVSKVREFYIGIPYGALLSVGGFLTFMITGSLSAIRFGVILGGALLALSVTSLRSWKKGEHSSLALKGQAAITSILFIRELRVLFARPVIANFVTALVGGAVATFYAYRIVMDHDRAKGSNLDGEAES